MTPDELEQIVEKEENERQSVKFHICVCSAAGCVSSNCSQVQDAIKSELVKQDLDDICKVKGVGCMGLCSEGPLVYIEEFETLYKRVIPEDAPKIVDHIKSSAKAEKLVCETGTPFFQNQTRIVTENFWKIDPGRIEDYIAAGGYSALITALTEMTPPEIINEVTNSGLRGRGGAGYPTGLKWSTVFKSVGSPKYVVCNADEGDPGAFMDRSILESDPHRVIEGMVIAAYAVGAPMGYIYVRAEYPLAIKRLRAAIKQAERTGFLGNNICDTPFRLTLNVRLGAGAFVCGEETALLSSIEGNRGNPRPRPPYPAESGMWDSPTLINNVETYANIAPIVNRGAEWYASIGTEKSKGTKVFALAGQIVNTGLIEVPMGMSLREIIFDIGGGIPDGRKFKAVQTGGPSGGCIPEEHLDIPVDYESLASIGSIMGSGGMIVMDESSNMVEVAKYFMDFCVSESCGKCVPCRVGTVHLYNLLNKFSEGTASGEDMDLLEDLCDLLKNTSLCGLGQTAPNPILSTLRYFREDYEARTQ